MVVRIEGVDATEAIPPVVALILSGDSTAPLTREARIYCFSKYSAVLEGLVQSELWQSECFEVLGIEVLSNSIPTIVGSA